MSTCLAETFVGFTRDTIEEDTFSFEFHFCISCLAMCLLWKGNLSSFIEMAAAIVFAAVPVTLSCSAIISLLLSVRYASHIR